MNKHHETTGPAEEQQITLRGPAELADALPYMMGFHPNDSIVLVAVHGKRGRFGGRLRLGIPSSPREWSPVAEQLAECLIEGSERRGSRPDGIVVFLCQDPAEGETSRRVMERLRPLAQGLRTACGTLEVPVYEALCISDSRFWSYCCPDARCCPPEGSALALPGTSVMAAAAAYAGVQVRGSLREMEGRLAPLTTAAAAGQEKALDTAGATLTPRILDEEGREQVAAETLALARRLMKRIAESPRSGGWAESDVADDRLVHHDEAAAVILGIQDRDTRDRAAEWMEGPDAGPALRLWRALARRCVGPYCEHSAAPLTLAGWVAWSSGDEPGARVALGRALQVDPDYVFARLLHEACNQGLDPETLRSCLRAAGSSRASSGSGGPDKGARGDGGLRVDVRRKAARSRPRAKRLGRPLGKKAVPPVGTRPAKAASADGVRGSRRSGSGEGGTRSGR
ncbi:uncharacterized protein DUF4192 [Streptomyces sp. SLBN-118]|uniref:DUF4192 domain-containing protein n=1 Tax=Streptomyces sp. SLBN-118 TaxID=2768454 RepID=UPI00114F1C6E|nr:DUF4192 domain-containing protein [Streptomyces sp. SLBN-118]TQK51411.1 uncharacterized protein DUF4192 [Streptomyces sp. SLBN-118]